MMNGWVANAKTDSWKWLAVSLGLVLAGCGAAVDKSPPAAEVPPPASAPPAEAAPVERVAFSYVPLGADAEALGSLKVMLPPGNEGSGRSLVFGDGSIIEATLLSAADISLPVGETSMADAIGVTQAALENGGNPKVYMLSVQSETVGSGAAACGDRPLTALLLRQPETEMDKTVTFVYLTALPTDPAVEICKRNVFTPG